MPHLNGDRHTEQIYDLHIKNKNNVLIAREQSNRRTATGTGELSHGCENEWQASETQRQWSTTLAQAIQRQSPTSSILDKYEKWNV